MLSPKTFQLQIGKSIRFPLPSSLHHLKMLWVQCLGIFSTGCHVDSETRFAIGSKHQSLFSFLFPWESPLLNAWLLTSSSKYPLLTNLSSSTSPSVTEICLNKLRRLAFLSCPLECLVFLNKRVDWPQPWDLMFPSFWLNWRQASCWL